MSAAEAVDMRSGDMGDVSGMAGVPAAAAVRARLEARGFALAAVDGKLRVSPAAELTGADADTIRRFRDALYELVAGEIGDAAADPGLEPARGTRRAPEMSPMSPMSPQRGQLHAHAEAVADRRRALMADDGTPSPCTECGGPALRNGTRLCASCWETWQSGATARG